MARKRMIDPSIWQSEDFGKLSNLAKIIFIGLFSLADDEGRGRANPTYLKSSLFPYNEAMRSTDVEVALSEISRNMSVIFYSCDGNSYYSLLSWNTFQKIDKAKESKIPAFEEDNQEIRRLFVEESSTSRRKVAPNIKEKNKKEENRKEIKNKRNRIVEIYNFNCNNLPQVQKLTEKREKNIDEFLKEFTEEQFEQICKIANATDFLIGKNKEKWKADFDFIMRIDKATAILEGKYGKVEIKETNQKEPKREIYFNSNDLTAEQYTLYMQGKLTDEDIRKILEAKNVR